MIYTKRGNQWKRLIKFINKHRINSIILRKKIIKYMYINPYFANKGPNATDYYLRLLEVTGFIDHPECGIRRKLHHIPLNISSFKLRKFYDQINFSPMNWFIVDKVEYFKKYFS